MDNELISQLKTHKLKVTTARVAILTFLKKTKTPADVTEIEVYLSKKNIEANQSTIYRILTAFVTYGVVKPVTFQEGKTRYELSSLPHHHHVICTDCGDVKDIEKCEIETLEKNISKNLSFKVKDHSLEFFGLCSKCQ